MIVLANLINSENKISKTEVHLQGHLDLLPQLAVVLVVRGLVEHQADVGGLVEELPVVQLLEFVELAEVDQVFEDENESLLAGHLVGLLFDLEQVLVEHFDRVGKQCAEFLFSFERGSQHHFFLFFGVALVVLPQHFSHVAVLACLFEPLNNASWEGEIF